MSLIKTPKEIEFLEEGGRRLASVLRRVGEAVEPGVTTGELNTLAEKLIAELGDKPAFKNYTPEGATRPYPAALCVSVEDEVVHGIPGARALEEGEIVGLDLGLVHKGLFTDMAITVPVGKVSEDKQLLMERTKESLDVGIAAIKPGAHIGDIGTAISKYISKFGYGIVDELAGHGVGHAAHEPPVVPNFSRKGKGMEIREGMVLALEPMINLGGKDVVFLDDGYTVVTEDHKPSAHFEHTIAVTKDGAIVLTKE